MRTRHDLELILPFIRLCWTSQPEPSDQNAKLIMAFKQCLADLCEATDSPKKHRGVIARLIEKGVACFDGLPVDFEQQITQNRKKITTLLQNVTQPSKNQTNPKDAPFIEEQLEKLAVLLAQEDVEQDQKLKEIRAAEKERRTFLTKLIDSCRNFLTEQHLTLRDLATANHPAIAPLALFLQRPQWHLRNSFKGLTIQFFWHKPELAALIIQDPDLFFAVTRDNIFGAKNITLLALRASGAQNPPTDWAEACKQLLADPNLPPYVAETLLMRTTHLPLIEKIMRDYGVRNSSDDEESSDNETEIADGNVKGPSRKSILARHVFSKPYNFPLIQHLCKLLNNHCSPAEHKRWHFDSELEDLFWYDETSTLVPRDRACFLAFAKSPEFSAVMLAAGLFHIFRRKYAKNPETDNWETDLRFLLTRPEHEVPLYVKDTLLLHIEEPDILTELAKNDEIREQVIFRLDSQTQEFSNEKVLERVAGIVHFVDPTYFKETFNPALEQHFAHRQAALETLLAPYREPQTLKTIRIIQQWYRWNRQIKQTETAQWTGYNIPEKSKANWRGLLQRLKTLYDTPERFKAALRKERGDGDEGPSELLTPREKIFFQTLLKREVSVQHGSGEPDAVLDSGAISSVLQRELERDAFSPPIQSRTRKDTGNHHCTFNGYKTVARSALFPNQDLFQTNLSNRLKHDRMEQPLWWSSETPICYTNPNGVSLPQIKFPGSTFDLQYRPGKRTEIYSYTDGSPQHVLNTSPGSEVIMGGDMIMPFRFLRFIEQLRMLDQASRDLILDGVESERTLKIALSYFTRVRVFEIYRLAKQRIDENVIVIPSKEKCEAIVGAIRDNQPIPHIDIDTCPIELLNDAYFLNETLLQHAVTHDRLDLVEHLLQRDGINIFARRIQDGQTVIDSLKTLPEATRYQFANCFFTYISEHLHDSRFVTKHYKHLLPAALQLDEFFGSVTPEFERFLQQHPPTLKALKKTTPDMEKSFDSVLKRLGLVQPTLSAFKRLLRPDRVRSSIKSLSDTHPSLRRMAERLVKDRVLPDAYLDLHGPFSLKHVLVLMSLSKRSAETILKDRELTQRLTLACEKPDFVKRHYETIRRALLMSGSVALTHTVLNTIEQCPEIPCFRLFSLGCLSQIVARKLYNNESLFARIQKDNILQIDQIIWLMIQAGFEEPTDYWMQLLVLLQDPTLPPHLKRALLSDSRDAHTGLLQTVIAEDVPAVKDYFATVDVDFKTTCLIRGRYSLSMVYIAVLLGNVELLQTLLEQGADAVEPHLVSSAKLAIKRSRPDLLSVLVDHSSLSPRTVLSPETAFKWLTTPETFDALGGPESPNFVDYLALACEYIEDHFEEMKKSPGYQEFRDFCRMLTQIPDDLYTQEIAGLIVDLDEQYELLKFFEAMIFYRWVANRTRPYCFDDPERRFNLVMLKLYHTVDRTDEYCETIRRCYQAEKLEKHLSTVIMQRQESDPELFDIARGCGLVEVDVEVQGRTVTTDCASPNQAPHSQFLPAPAGQAAQGTSDPAPTSKSAFPSP